MTSGAPSQLGPYRVVSVLGQGGMGTVYAAEDARDGTRAAVKVARVHPASRRALELEIQALSRLSHPGIVRFLDHGVADGVVWVATELVDGSPLRDRVQSTHSSTGSSAVSTVVLEDLTGLGDPATAVEDRVLWTHESLLPALQVFRRLCTPLAWLHGEGLVHGDVKPENVLVRDDGSVVLVDFGLFRQLGVHGRDVLTPSRRLAGTVAYLSPEQCRGESPDARSDLYAVGCMLYEWLTGRPPFGRTSAAVRLHAETPAPPIADFAVVPEPVEQLVGALLAKSPRLRMGYATDLAEALEALGVEAERSPGPPPRRALYRPPLLGRDPELARLLEPQAQVVAAESGVGRTRLLSALVERSRATPVIAVDGGVDLGSVRAILRGLAARCGDAATAGRWFGHAPDVLVAIEPSLADLDGIGPQPVPEALPPQAAIARSTSAVARAIERAAPVRVVVDDVHLADERDVATLVELARRRPPAVWFAASAPAGHPVLQAFEAVGAEVLMLQPLADEHMDALVGECLAVQVLPVELTAFVRERAQGNPGFVSEVLRLVVDEGHLVRRRGRWVVTARDDLASLPIPSGVAELAARRWEALPAEVRAAVEGLAVGGSTASDAELTLAAGAGVIEVREGSVRWRVPPMRELASAGLSAERRRSLHERTIGRLADAAPAEVRAGHLEGAGRIDEAREAWRGAVREAMATGAWGAMLRCADRVLACGATGAERLDAWIEGIAALRMRGRWSEAVERSDRALADARDAEPQALRRCRNQRGRALVRAHRHDEGIAELEAVAAEVTEPDERARALSALGEALSEAGRLPASVAVRREALALVATLGDPMRVAEASVALANVLQRQDLVLEAGALLDRAMPVLRTGAHRMWLANALATTALVAASSGDDLACEAASREARDLFRALGMLASETQVLGVLADALRRQGRRAACLATLEAMDALASEVGSPRLLAAVAFNRAMLELTLGTGEPLTALLHCVELARASHHGQAEGTAALHAAVRMRVLGRWDEARPLIARVAELAEERGDLGFTCSVACERGHHALHDGRDGRDELALAERLLAELPASHPTYVHEVDALRRAVLGAASTG